MRGQPITSIPDWNGEPLGVANSQADESGTWFVLDYARNLIRAGIAPWPAPALLSQLRRSYTLSKADPAIQKLAAEGLGFYCDLQSLHSEDAITWSFFGPLAHSGDEAAAQFLNWLCERFDLPWTENRSCRIDLWRRVIHPKTLGMSGPELDFLLSGDQCVIFGEAKWFSSEGKHGPEDTDTQMHFRRDVLHDHGRALFGDRGRALVGVALDQGIENETPDPVDDVETRAVYWADLCEYASHPSGDEFSRYYDWKQEHMSDAKKRAKRGRSRIRPVP